MAIAAENRLKGVGSRVGVLDNYDAQMAAGNQLRKDKNSPFNKGGEGDLSAEQGGTSFRERVMAARQALDIKEKAKQTLEKKVAAPAKAGTSWLLKASWLNLIDSFGLTLIYINAHVFLRYVFPDAFCKLGEEWKPKIVGETSTTNVGGTVFGIVEVIGILLLDLIAIFIIMGALAFISMIISWYLNPLQLLTDIFNLSWSGIKALVDLFSSVLKK